MSDEPITKAELPIIRKFMNHTITLRDDWRFNVDGPEFEGQELVCASHELEAATRATELEAAETKAESENPEQ